MADGEDLDFDTVDFKDVQLSDNVLGHGAFGVVREGRLDHTPVAIKFLKEEQQVLSQLRKEVEFLKRIHHPHVLLFRGVCLAPPSIITELCELGSVMDVINLYNQIRAPTAESTVPLFAITREKQETIEKAMSWPGRVKLALDAAKGMLHLHSKNLLHCDLKSGNLLVDGSRTCKVADFGLSRKITGKQSEINAPCPNNPTWLAPEVAADPRNCSKAGDVYSFGIVMWELLMLQQPNPCYFAHPTERPPLPDDITRPPGCVAGSCATTQMPGLDLYVELMKSAWAEKPEMRPDFKQVVQVLEVIDAKITGDAWHPGLPEDPLQHFLYAMKTAGLQDTEPKQGNEGSVYERVARNAEAALQNPLLAEAMTMALEGNSQSGQPPISLQDWINVAGASRSPAPSANLTDMQAPASTSAPGHESSTGSLSGILHAPSLPESCFADRKPSTANSAEQALPPFSEKRAGSEASGSFQSSSGCHPRHPEHGSDNSRAPFQPPHGTGYRDPAQPKPGPSSGPVAWSPFASPPHRHSYMDSALQSSAAAATAPAAAAAGAQGPSISSPFERHCSGANSAVERPGEDAMRISGTSPHTGGLDLASRLDPNLLAAAKMIGSGGFERTLKYGTDSFSFPTTASMTTSSGHPSGDYGRDSSRNGTRGSSVSTASPFAAAQMRTREASPSDAVAPMIISPFAAPPQLRHVRSADAKPQPPQPCATNASAPSVRSGRT